jgi:hypothetical protein
MVVLPADRDGRPSSEFQVLLFDLKNKGGSLKNGTGDVEQVTGSLALPGVPVAHRCTAVFNKLEDVLEFTQSVNAVWSCGGPLLPRFAIHLSYLYEFDGASVPAGALQESR